MGCLSDAKCQESRKKINLIRIPPPKKKWFDVGSENRGDINSAESKE